MAPSLHPRDVTSAARTDPTFMPWICWIFAHTQPAGAPAQRRSAGAPPRKEYAS